jgi:hypothetical protein
MKILYLHQYFVNPDSAGGTRSYEFARRLVQRGHEVTVVTSSASMKGDFVSQDRVTRRELDGIKLVVLRTAARRLRTLRRAIGRGDDARAG